MIDGPSLSPAACGPHRPGYCTQRKSAPYELGQRASFWVAAGVVAHTLWTSAAPAMTYPLFAAEWHLTHTVTTGVFAIYPIVVAAVLVGFGDVSDYIGRRAAILWGVGASLVGTLLFALAPDVLWLFAGRAFMGIGVGLTAGPSTAAMVEFNGQGAAKRAVTITTAAQAVGFAAALLLGGALVQYAPLPTRLNFWALFAVLAALFVAAWFLPRHTGSEAQGRWRPKTPVIPSHLRNVFAVAAAAVTSAYTHGVLILSLGSQVARDLVGSPNTLVNGALAVQDAALQVEDFRNHRPDAVIGPNGALTPVTALSFLVGAVAHPIEGNDIYVYYGQDQTYGNSWTVAATQGGWGNPNFVNNGCFNQNLTGGTLGTFNTPIAGFTCTFDVQKAQEFTIGFWQDLYKGNMGRVRAGLQYEYVKLTAFPGLPTGAGTPNQGLTPNNNIAFFSLRYYPFN